MPGFKLNRPNGTVAIDSNYFNLALRSKGSISTYFRSQANSTVRGCDLTLPSDQGILAIRAPQPVAITYYDYGNGQITYHMYGMATSDFTIDYWHFDLPQYGQMFASGGKMIVRNPRNQVVFDSRMKYLKIQDFYTPDLKSTSDDVRTYPRLPAIVCVNRSWGHVQQPMTQFQTRIEDISSCGWTDGNTVKIGVRNTYYMLRPYQQSDRYIQYGGGNATTMVVDVQDY